MIHHLPIPSALTIEQQFKVSSVRGWRALIERALTALRDREAQVSDLTVALSELVAALDAEEGWDDSDFPEWQRARAALAKARGEAQP